MSTNKKTGSVAKTRHLTLAAMTAALYILLTVLSSTLNLASSAIQLRLSEALTVLPCFFSSAVPGLFAGCLLANLLTGAPIWDVLFGAIATLLGAAGAYALRRHPLLAVLPAIASNTLIIPFVLRYAYGIKNALPFLFLTVGIGEALSAGVLGILLYRVLLRIPSLRDHQ